MAKGFLAVNAMAGRQGFVSRPLCDRFWEKVDTNGGPDACWLWLGSLNIKGYGQILREKNGKLVLATHVSWEFKHEKPFPSGKMCCHTCDTPACVNPLHLWIGDARLNTLDAMAKGRHVPPRRS